MSKGPQHYIIYDSDTPIAAALKRICNRKTMKWDGNLVTEEVKPGNN